MNPENMRPDNSSWHPKFDDVVYWGMDWDCPSYNYVLSTQIGKFYGNITPELAIEQFMAVTQTGDDHLAIYDLPHGHVYVSFAAQNGIGGPINAYQRQFTILDLNLLFNEPAPGETKNNDIHNPISFDPISVVF